MKRLILRARRQALVQSVLDAIVTRAFHTIVGNEAERQRTRQKQLVEDATTVVVGGAGEVGVDGGIGIGIGGVLAPKVGAASGNDSQFFPIVRAIFLVYF